MRACAPRCNEFPPSGPRDARASFGSPCGRRRATAEDQEPHRGTWLPLVCNTRQSWKDHGGVPGRLFGSGSHPARTSPRSPSPCEDQPPRTLQAGRLEQVHLWDSVIPRWVVGPPPVLRKLLGASSTRGTPALSRGRLTGLTASGHCTSHLRRRVASLPPDRTRSTALNRLVFGPPRRAKPLNVSAWRADPFCSGHRHPSVSLFSIFRGAIAPRRARGIDSCASSWSRIPPPTRGSCWK